MSTKWRFAKIQISLGKHLGETPSCGPNVKHPEPSEPKNGGIIFGLQNFLLKTKHIQCFWSVVFVGECPKIFHMSRTSQDCDNRRLAPFFIVHLLAFWLWDCSGDLFLVVSRVNTEVSIRRPGWWWKIPPTKTILPWGSKHHLNHAKNATSTQSMLLSLSDFSQNIKKMLDKSHGCLLVLFIYSGHKSFIMGFIHW